jgi:hypothetical protein
MTNTKRIDSSIRTTSRRKHVFRAMAPIVLTLLLPAITDAVTRQSFLRR